MKVGRERHRTSRRRHNAPISSTRSYPNNGGALLNGSCHCTRHSESVIDQWHREAAVVYRYVSYQWRSRHLRTPNMLWHCSQAARSHAVPKLYWPVWQAPVDPAGHKVVVGPHGVQKVPLMHALPVLRSVAGAARAPACMLRECGTGDACVVSAENRSTVFQCESISNYLSHFFLV